MDKAVERIPQNIEYKISSFAIMMRWYILIYIVMKVWTASGAECRVYLPNRFYSTVMDLTFKLTNILSSVSRISLLMTVISCGSRGY